MNDPFDRRDGPGLEVTPFHDRGIHATHPVELNMRAQACIEQTAPFQHANHLLDRGQRRCAAIQKLISDFQCGRETAGLRRGHAAQTGTAMDKEHRTGRFQLSNRPFTRR